jgi:hypothetical protein
LADYGSWFDKDVNLSDYDGVELGKQASANSPDAVRPFRTASTGVNLKSAPIILTHSF